MKRSLSYLIIIIGLIITSCATQRVSTVVGFNYDENKNQTDYFVLPYGSVSLPGKWEKTHYNSISMQQFFINSDSIEVAIAFNRFDKYEFNSDGSKKEMDFVEAFYEWDSKYFVDSYGLHRKLIEKDSINKYILYKIYGRANNGGEFDTYFLIGEKNGNASNLSIIITDKWTENEKGEFLKKLFVKN